MLAEQTLNPRPAPEGEPIRITLSPDDPANQGFPPFDPDTDNGIFIGYDPATQTWTLDHASGARRNSSPSSTIGLVALLMLTLPSE